ncbi:hypothetical protein [Micromonospora sp. NPDC048169]|uniref:hypothetical protein n=1 Tax=Micromonospora sp. NPDC048169 TaxID=3154711 RepID=UPI0033DD691A
MSRKEKTVHSRVPTGANSPGKQPAAAPTRYEDQQIRFRFGRLDHGRWALCDIDKAHHKRLLNRLAHFENLTVGQAKQQGLLADYDMSTFPNRQAAKRLAEQYDGQDSISRLKVAPGENLRLLGIRELNEFHIVWWDPAHVIWDEGKIRR